MGFLTKNQIREKVEDFLIGYDNNTRILYNEDTEKEFIHIGTSFERIKSKYQTSLLNDNEDKIDKRIQKEHDIFLKDKNTRQGIFDIPKEKDFSR